MCSCPPKNAKLGSFTSLSCSDGIRKEMYKKIVMHVQSCCFARNGGVKNSGHVHTIPETFCARAKIIRIGPLLTHKNGCGGAISGTERSCAAPISKVERHTSDRFCAKFCCSMNRYSDWFTPVFEGLLYVEDFTTNWFSRSWNLFALVVVEEQEVVVNWKIKLILERRLLNMSISVEATGKCHTHNLCFICG